MNSDLTPNFEPDNIFENISKVINIGMTYSALASNGVDWESVVGVLDEAEHLIGKEMSVNSHENSVRFTDEFNTQYEKTLPLISNFYSDLGANKDLYQAFKRVSQTELNVQQQHIVNDSLRSFELSGVALDGAKSERFKEIKEQLSILSNQFSKNVLQSTNSWKKTVSANDLKGYGADEFSKVKKGDHFEISLQVPVYIDLMTYADSNDLREEVYKAYISRASDVGITSKEFNNRPIMDEILKLRSEMSELVGFSNYAEYSTQSKMVESPDAVIEFLNSLIELSTSQAKAELIDLESFAGHPLMPWDLMYYSEKLKQKTFRFKSSDLKPFFPESSVFDGLFETIQNLYNVKLTEIHEKTYHEDVRVIKLEDNNGVIGRVYLDVYARENKRGGAWMSDYQGLYKESLPVAFVVCNLNSPSEGKPALFDFDEIVTIFHEFGHALHHLLTKVPFPCAAGISGVPWDGVELPSQYMENFCYEREVVNLISGHWETGEKLPEELFQKVIESKNFQSGLQMLRQCEFALWDISTHISKDDTYEILSKVREKTALMPIVAENRFLNSFSHIFSGGYAAGYFSYKWAEVLAADAYEFVKESGGIGSKSSNNFRRHILEIGGSLDFMDQYIKFRGSRPKMDGLLKASGISIK
ncbi:M3 family metallopeptidase [Candidatus Pseudothioglobus singularis]|uniref:oligopeptidase A n=1 Tax=Candidatus Pseudothioglobus singularis PS1 TaxID=1125411 RepID=A0A0M5KRS0_9GAMM|nr:M3 family metallopeptidase [Candidatus Pseudothioglobus singularis]ALE01840.1 oligopeptidase A [Candidatus Pseudothioglobus singularis PS1]